MLKVETERWNKEDEERGTVQPRWHFEILPAARDTGVPLQSKCSYQFIPS